MTNKRAAEAGYDVEDVCPLCGAVGDSVRHRTSSCPATAEVVAEAIPQLVIDEGAAVDDADMFWNTAVLPHPGDNYCLPAAEGELVGEEFVSGE